MPKKYEPINGQLMNEKYQIYSMKDGERGVCVIWRDELNGQKVTLTFNGGRKKTFYSNTPEIVKIAIAKAVVGSFPKLFEILPEMPKDPTAGAPFANTNTIAMKAAA